jgi:hypothetical protein
MYSGLMLYTVPFTDLFNPQNLATSNPNPPPTHLLAWQHFLTVSPTADKQYAVERYGHIANTVWKTIKKTWRMLSTEVLSLISVSMLDSFCSLKVVLYRFLHQILRTVKVFH